MAVERYDAGDATSELSTLNSWVQKVRKVFDLMPAQGEEAAASIARRIAAVPRACRQLSVTLPDAARNGRCAAGRQVQEAAGQCWALTRCAKRLPASKDAQQSTDRPGRHDINLPDRH